MEKKIPKVFENKVNSHGNNNDVFYSHDNFEEKGDVKKEGISVKKNINQKINDIFNSSSYVYKADVLIKTKNGDISKRIVGRNSTYLITMDNELIPISDIIDIESKS